MNTETISQKLTSYSLNGVPVLTYGLVGVSAVLIGSAFMMSDQPAAASPVITAPAPIVGGNKKKMGGTKRKTGGNKKTYKRRR